MYVWPLEKNFPKKNNRVTENINRIRTSSLKHHFGTYNSFVSKLSEKSFTTRKLGQTALFAKGHSSWGKNISFSENFACAGTY